MNPDTNRFEKLNAPNDEMKAVEKQFETLHTEAHEYGDSPLQEHLGGFLKEQREELLLRLDGSPVPGHWSTFQVDENYVINNYTFKCKYIGETSILFEPVGPIEIGK